MKVAFFQPYLAAWRIEFLERFVAESPNSVVIYDGGHKVKGNAKSVNGNKTHLDKTSLWSPSLGFKYRGQNYPVFFSPGLIFSLIKNRPDVIITEGEINIINNIFIYIYCRIFSASYVWWSLGKVRARRETIFSKLAKPFLGLLIRGAGRIVAKNSYAKEYYIKKWGIPADRVVVAPNSMDEVRAKQEVDESLAAELASKKGAHPVILYAGALTAAKRPLDLVHVLHKLNAKGDGHPPPQLWFVGDGPMRSEIEAEVDRLGLRSLVTFFGRVTKGVGSFFEAADVTVVPGLGGLVINHAMIFGCPVISGEADGTELDLIIDGQTGYLFDNANLTALENAILKIIRSDDPLSMRRNCREIIDQRWNMGLMIRQFEMAIAASGARG